jgi:RNA-directed DNA polymerase
LAIHEGKTRLIALGRRAARQRELSGMQRPETFDFLSFTHYCDKTRSGRFTVKKKTQSKRMIRKLKTLRGRE